LKNWNIFNFYISDIFWLENLIYKIISKLAFLFSKIVCFMKKFNFKIFQNKFLEFKNIFLLGYEKRGLFQFKNMFLNPKTDNKTMFLKVRSYGS